MDASQEIQPTGGFKCQLCSLTVLCMSCFWKKPVMKDPFTPNKDKFLILGFHCRLCSRSVFIGTQCSLFYSKRFNLHCVKEDLKASPLEIQEDMDKRKPQHKS
ncbi:PREDICTED: cysteine-rich DPF motif domain-containing protein 1 [Acanthisitta chloris]|uniref:cysteine-rich DPF motif domain-containing protein 1 n=1 Tax=Acanthisitta chloris TaxID=57068 RepID=UPI0004F0CD2D|nr:PREDICTED: cysteine-rich DPF motif domain-containing protein 1 [Acanthisitta chloris]